MKKFLKAYLAIICLKFNVKCFLLIIQLSVLTILHFVSGLMFRHQSTTKVLPFQTETHEMIPQITTQECDRKIRPIKQ